MTTSEARCGYFSLGVESASVPTTGIEMRFPVYGCGLSEQLCHRLQMSVEGGGYIALFCAEETSKAGPDTAPLHPHSCHHERRQNCEREFTEMLALFALDTSLPPSEEAERLRDNESER